MSDSEASFCEEDLYEIIKPAYDFKLTGLADGIGVNGMGHIEHNRSEQTKIIYLFSHILSQRLEFACWVSKHIFKGMVKCILRFDKMKSFESEVKHTTVN